MRTFSLLPAGSAGGVSADESGFCTASGRGARTMAGSAPGIGLTGVLSLM